MLRIEEAKLEHLARRLLEVAGAPTETASKVAASLVGADLRGHGSHGTLQLETYLTRIEESDWVDPAAEPSVAREDGISAVVDGNRAFGQLVGRRAVEVGVEKAREHGMAGVGIRNGAHLGRIGEWAERAADSGLLFAAFVTTTGSSRFWVAPPGSTRRRLSTNPVAFGVPTFDARPFPVVHDVATSQVAAGKIREQRRKGEPIPDDWAVADDGSAATDPSQFIDSDAGALLPLGGRTTGHKGFGLAVIAELFASFLGDTAVSGQPGPELTQNVAAFCFLDPTQYSSVATIETRIEVLSEHLRSVDYETADDENPSAMDGVGQLPGEPEHCRLVDRRDRGIPLPDGTVGSLRDLAAAAGIEDEVPNELQ